MGSHIKTVNGDQGTIIIWQYCVPHVLTLCLLIAVANGYKNIIQL